MVLYQMGLVTIGLTCSPAKKEKVFCGPMHPQPGVSPTFALASSLWQQLSRRSGHSVAARVAFRAKLVRGGGRARGWASRSPRLQV
jgi:hypothetical protein